MKTDVPSVAAIGSAPYSNATTGAKWRRERRAISRNEGFVVCDVFESFGARAVIERTRIELKDFIVDLGNLETGRSMLVHERFLQLAGRPDSPVRASCIKAAREVRRDKRRCSPSLAAALVGQSRRANAGLWYGNESEFKQLAADEHFGHADHLGRDAGAHLA